MRTRKSGRTWHSLLENRPPLTWTPDPVKSSTVNRLVSAMLPALRLSPPSRLLLSPRLLFPSSSDFVSLSPVYRSFFPSLFLFELTVYTTRRSFSRSPRLYEISSKKRKGKEKEIERVKSSYLKGGEIFVENFRINTSSSSPFNASPS